MPGIVWAIIVVWGTLTGSALLGPPAIWEGRDPTVNRKHYRPAAVEYRSWTSSPERLADHSCRFTVFALATRESLTRLQVNGVEQLLDWSWSWTADLPNGVRGEDMKIEFLDPVGGAVLATHLLSENCWK